MIVVRYLVSRAPGLSLSVKRMGGVRSGRGHIMFLSLLRLCLSVCLSQAGVESKRRDGLSWGFDTNGDTKATIGLPYTVVERNSGFRVSPK